MKQYIVCSRVHHITTLTLSKELVGQKDFAIEILYKFRETWFYM